MRARLMSVVLVVTVLAVAALFVPAAQAIREAHERGDVLELQREAAIVAARVPPTGAIDAGVLQPIIDSDHRLGLYDHDGNLLGGVGPDPGDALVLTGIAGQFAEARSGDDLVAVVPLRLQDAGSSLVLRIEKPKDESNDQFRRSIVELGAMAAGIVVLAGAVALWLARRLNRPIEELRDWAASPAVGPAPEPPAATGIVELDALRAAIVSGRQQVAELLRRERSFSSHVSHQLRTPVAAMRVAVETELSTPRADPAETLHELLDQLDRLESTVTSLLAVARGGARPPVDCRLDEIVIERVRPWRDAAARSGRAVRVIAPPARVHTEPTAVGHIVDVLLDNALRHGAGTVTVTIDPAAGTLDVADEGVPPVGRDPFADDRGAEGRAESHGIGLRLARTLAESAHGQLVLTDADTTTFRLSVAPADPLT